MKRIEYSSAQDIDVNDYILIERIPHRIIRKMNLKGYITFVLKSCNGRYINKGPYPENMLIPVMYKWNKISVKSLKKRNIIRINDNIAIVIKIDKINDMYTMLLKPIESDKFIKTCNKYERVQLL
mgnify:CR=1 FL=1|tara:strand:+ start:916 stop:1290 length:375 start_codon:yes stop_codon:yes gene_type:complete